MTRAVNTSPSSVLSMDASMEHHSKNNSLQGHVADAHDDDGEAKSSSSPATVGFRLHETRSLILRLTALIGNLCSLVLQTIPLDPAMVKDGRADISSSNSDHVANSQVKKAIAQILSCLLDISVCTSINLETAILKKMELNRLKYPVDLCKAKACKYTEYSHKTGITKDAGQSTIHLDVGLGKTSQKNEESPLKKKESLSALNLDGVTEVLDDLDIHEKADVNDDASAIKAEFAAVLPALTLAIRQFAQDRLWSIYHLPRNLILALVGEVGELTELLQWKGDDDNDGTFVLELAELDKLSQELADVTIYLIRFADVCHVSLKEEMEREFRNCQNKA